MLTGNVGEIDFVAADAVGWVGILTALRNYLESLDETIHVDQVKEKFGALRFYFHFEGSLDRGQGNLDQISDVIDAAEELTRTTCYLCPRRVTRQGSGAWIRFFCNEHDTADVVRLRNSGLGEGSERQSSDTA